METVTIILAGILVMIGTYLLLTKNFVRVILGTAILTHAVHLLIMAMGRLKTGGVPMLDEQVESLTDALPQALILTSIVISFAVTAFILVLAYRAYMKLGTDNLEELRGTPDE